jgi:hypothetical protein
LLSNQGPELSRKSLSLGRNQVSPGSRENSIDESIEFLSFTDDNIAYDLKDFSYQRKLRQWTLHFRRQEW